MGAACALSPFNGATAFRRWKLVVARDLNLEIGTPSMGPPPFGDGNNAELEKAAISIVSLQWGHRLSAMETSRPKSITNQQYFNLQWGHRLSAMETSVRAPTAGSAICPLQWGHRLSAMETRSIGQWVLDPAHPSMGPPPFGDGNSQYRPVGTGPCPSFNGATAFRRWKPLFVARLRHGFTQKRSFPQESVTG